MADLTIQHLRYIARHVKITAEMIECGDGWLYLVDELLAELPQGTVVERIADVDGRLQVTATGEPVVTHMVSAAHMAMAAGHAETASVLQAEEARQAIDSLMDRTGLTLR